MAGGNPALQTLPLQRDAVLLWKSLEQELGADFEITTTGGLMVAENHDQTDFLRRKVVAERSVGIDVEVIGRDDLARIAPAISERMVVASHCPLEGKINPLKATPALLKEAKRCGARFSHGHAITAIERTGEGYSVTTPHATIRARRVVIAAGGWSRPVGRLAGVTLPIHGAPLQMLVTEPTRPILAQLVAHADRHLTMKQAANGKSHHRRRLDRLDQSGHRLCPHPAHQHRGQSLGRRAHRSGALRAASPAQLGGDERQYRRRAFDRRDPRRARPLRRRHRQRLYARAR